MKLSTAIGILSAHSALATLVSEDTPRSSSERKRPTWQNELSSIGSTGSRRDDGRVLLNRSGPGTSIGKKKTPLTGTPSATTSTRSSSRALNDVFQMVECNPEVTPAETTSTNADVGVLGSCNPLYEACMASDQSSLGGFCYNTFRIDLVCDPESFYYQWYYSCDCSAFDVQTRTGSISCLDSSIYYGCNDNVSSQKSIATFILDDNIYTSRAFCSEWDIRVNVTTTTATTKSCVEWKDMTNGTPFSLNGTTSCEVQMDGQMCTSCTYSLGFYDLYVHFNPWIMQIVDPFKADCSNVVDGLMIAPADIDMYRRLRWTDFPINQACYDCDLTPDYCEGSNNTTNTPSGAPPSTEPTLSSRPEKASALPNSPAAPSPGFLLLASSSILCVGTLLMLA
jgi:hypothetical protein